MNKRKTWVSLIVIMLFPLLGLSQRSDTLSLQEQIALLESEMDSLMIYNLISSILKEDKVYSEFSARLSYNSSITSAGRTYSLDQHGLAPGVSFYHKSGAFADVSGFWGSSFDPKYSLTVGTLGYLKLIGTKWSVSGNYERWFYNYETSSSANSLGSTVSYSSKYLYGSLDYSFLFGNKTSNRVIATTSGNYKSKKLWVFNSVSLRPTVSAVYGNQYITLLFSESDKTASERLRYIHENLDQRELRDYASAIITQEDRNRIEMILRDRQTERREKAARILAIYLSYDEIRNYIDDALSTTVNSYGLMNVSLSLPVQFRIKNLTFTTSYTYNIPIRLPGETGTLDPVGYFGLSVSYRIPLR